MKCASKTTLIQGLETQRSSTSDKTLEPRLRSQHALCRAAVSTIKQLGLYGIAKRSLRALKKGSVDVRMQCRQRLSDPRVVERYLANHQPAKLQLGAGEHALAGWLNTDLMPDANGVYLDATQRFPLADASFDFAYSEHMIEHIPFAAGQQMLAECLRVLKPGGVIRIATPDLAFLVALYRSNDDLRRRYMHWNTDEHISSAPFCADTFVINNFVRDWGHQFIYDEKVLAHSLDTAGFNDIKRCALNASEHQELTGLANTTRMPDGFLELETLVIEGTKS